MEYIIQIYKYNNGLPVATYITDSARQRNDIVNREKKKIPYGIRVNHRYVWTRDGEK